MPKLQSALGIVLALLLSACAGTDFKRPDPQSLVVGQSTAADVARVMGTPFQTGQRMKNNEMVKTASYAYAAAGGGAKYPGVVPARAMSFFTFNELLVGQEFSSSFAEDATDFDETKVKAIVIGKSTRADVLALLGRPSGDAIYPLVKGKRERGVVYTYNQAKGSAFDMKFYNKRLVVSIDETDVVTDVEYESSGEK